MQNPESEQSFRFSLFWYVTQFQLEFNYSCFCTTCLSYLQGSIWLLKVGPIDFPEISVTKCESTLINLPEQRISHSHRAQALNQEQSVLVVPTLEF